MFSVVVVVESSLSSLFTKKDFANLCCEKDAKEVLISLPAFHPHPSPPPRGKPPTNRRAGSCCAHSGTYCRDITGGEMDSNGFYKVIISNILYLFIFSPGELSFIYME